MRSFRAAYPLAVSLPSAWNFLMPCLRTLYASRQGVCNFPDRFLMIRDLFNGNEQMFEDTVTTLDEFDDLDECMIYIVENFAWNPDSDGARLLTDIIQRKLS